MVLGIGEGSIEIILPKPNYTSGETIKGKVVLKLNEPKKARELRVELIAEQKRTRAAYSRRGVRTTTEVVRIYGFKLPLKGEGVFSSSEYDFELQVPKLGEAQKPTEGQRPTEGVFGAIALAAQALGLGAAPVYWYVQATLDMPLAFDITKRIQISVV